jgi:hypothetical protein
LQEKRWRFGSNASYLQREPGIPGNFLFVFWNHKRLATLARKPRLIQNTTPLHSLIAQKHGNGEDLPLPLGRGLG